MRARVISSWFGIAAVPLCAIVATAAPQTTQSAVQPPVQPSDQSSGASANSNDQATNEPAAGTTICVKLTKTIDANKAKPGDAITTRVTLPVLDKGRVVLPNDTKITGRVVSAKKRSGDEGQSEVTIVFDGAVLKDGTVVPLALTVQAIGRSAMTAVDLARQDGDDGSPFGGTTARQPATSPATRQPIMIPPPAAREAPTPRAPEPLGPGVPGGQHPALDTGSHGTVGLPNLTLIESTDATRGSVVRATKSNVKLESGMEMILRVVRADKAKSKD